MPLDSKDIFKFIKFSAIAKYTPFEWCVGVNGRVMITTKHPQVTAQVCRIFPLITFLNNDQIETLVQRALG